MSRIEKALEMAKKQRNDSGSLNLQRTNDNAPVASLENGIVPSAEGLKTLTPLEITNPMLVAMQESNDVISEEYNKLRSLVVKLTKGEPFKNTLMISSTVSGEGKTLTALNLAIALAKEYDHTVLLVDTDLRRPSVHTFLGIEPRAGLIQCLKDGLALSEVLIKTGIGKLVVLPAGGTVDNPVELLSSNRMKEIIQELKNRYPDRYVIFDTPPILPFADALVLTESVDATIFVVRERIAKLQHVKKIISDLQQTNLLGVVYNDIRSFTSANSYYYY